MPFRPTLPLSLVLLVLAVTATPPAQAQVRRCSLPDGKTVFTDRRCDEVGGVDRLPRQEASTSGLRRSYRGGCARNLQDLFYEVTQADLDGKGGGDGDIDNTATADSNETEEVDDSEDVPLDYSPSFTVEKAVSFDGVTFDDADDPDGPQASIMQAPTFLITIANTGNVTLTGFTIEDVNYTFDTVNGTTIDLGGAVLSGDTDNDGDLDGLFALGTGRALEDRGADGVHLGAHEGAGYAATPLGCPTDRRGGR